MPPMKPSTMWRAFRSRRVILLRTFESRNLCVASAMTNPLRVRRTAPLRSRHLGERLILLERRFLRGDDFEQLVHDLVRRHPFRFGGEGRDDAVTQHRMGDGPDVLG